MRTRKSAPMLTANQRRSQIIDLLAGHLVRIPLALAVPPPREDGTEFERGLTRTYNRKCQNPPLSHSASPPTDRQGKTPPNPAKTQLDVAGEMPLSVTTG